MGWMIVVLRVREELEEDWMIEAWRRIGCGGSMAVGWIRVRRVQI